MFKKKLMNVAATKDEFNVKTNLKGEALAQMCMKIIVVMATSLVTTFGLDTEYIFKEAKRMTDITVENMGEDK